MKLKKMLKRVLLGLCVLAFVFVVPTHAATKMCNEASPAEIDVKERYGLSLEHKGGDSFVLKMNPKTNKTERCKMTFKVAEINSHASTVTKELSCDHDLELTISDRTDDTDYGLAGVIIKIETTKKVKKNENESKSCYYSKGTVTFEKTVPITASKKKDESCPEEVAQGEAVLTPEIDCNKTYETGSFEYKFCFAKNAATGNKKYDFTGKGGTYSSYTGTERLPDFTCNYDVATVPLEPEKLKGEDYYVNKQYIYGTNTTTETNGKYQYYYSPDHATEGDAVSCKITCEEAVEVEYGPPVASKAGMCFEYKVRVTSRVTCNMSEAPKPPKHDCDYCTPTPSCSGSSGKVWRQGGPNEDFDACVKSCDGGKYTTKCSNKCYKKIYGTTKSATKSTYSSSEEVIATKTAEETYDGSLEACKKLNPWGCYRRDNGGIEWYKGSDPQRGGEGRWYSENPGGRYHNGEYVLDERGFWRRKYADGSICHDNCTWGDCGDSEYLNPGMGAKDYEKNAAKYYEAINVCKAKAICNTTTSEYTITADYKRGGETISINFPYDSKKDHLTHIPSKEDKVDDTLDQANTTLLPDDVEEGQGILGCYKRKANEENLYRSTWGFPGTWINGKTGEISYEPGNKSASWREYPDKFCIPSDAQGVNERWWNAFNNRKMKEQAAASGTEWSVFTSEEVDSKCESSKTDTVADPKPISNEDITWNIRAHAEKFGYFEWNINMKCFYALNPRPTTKVSEGNSTSGANKSCDPTEDNYRVRSVNLENMFPEKTGTELSQEQRSAAENNTGRTPGYNWSEYATNTKNPNYVSNPTKTIQRIQTLGYGVYNDQYLDYEFELTPKIIREMRAQSSAAGYTGSNYTNFDNNEFKVDSKGVSRYYSNKIRNGIGLIKAPSSRSDLENNNIREG